MESLLRVLKENIEDRVKGRVILELENGKIYVVIASNNDLLWGKAYTVQELNGLMPNQIGRVVKDDYEKFIISQYIKC